MKTSSALEIFLLSISVASFAMAQSGGVRKIGEVPESADSYRDPGFRSITMAQGSSHGPEISHSMDPAILNFKGQRSPGLPENLEAAERPNFPNFKFAENNQVILYEERNGKKLERIVSRGEFEEMKSEFEKQQSEQATHSN